MPTGGAALRGERSERDPLSVRHGTPAAEPQGGDRRSAKINGSAALIHINGEAFLAYVGQVLAPELERDDGVVMDNLSSHKGSAMRELIKAAGASPPYSRGLNPDKQAFAKLKPHLRHASERSVHSLWSTISRILDLYTPAERAHHIALCGYDAA